VRRWFVYILECGDATLYTGVTNDLPRRLAAHRRGRASRYTRSRPPVRLVYQETRPDRSTALKREATLKGLVRVEKLRLIRDRPAARERPEARKRAAAPPPGEAS
jgi:predicted GIY-YIG superfamily endonuclease